MRNLFRLLFYLKRSEPVLIKFMKHFADGPNLSCQILNLVASLHGLIIDHTLKPPSIETFKAYLSRMMGLDRLILEHFNWFNDIILFLQQISGCVFGFMESACHSGRGVQGAVICLSDGHVCTL